MENTVHVVDELARTRHEERVRNPQPFFEEVMRSFSHYESTEAHAFSRAKTVVEGRAHSASRTCGSSRTW